MNMAQQPTTSVVLPSPSTFRFPHPPFYEGARDGFKCDAWLTTVQRFFVGAKIATEEMTLHAIIFLTGTASLWWEPHPYLIPHHGSTSLRPSARSSAQSGLALLDDTIKTCFYKGAPLVLQQMLQGFEVSDPGNSDLQTLLSTAERFDNIYHFRPDSASNPKSASSLANAQTIATAPTFNQPDPSAMEVDHIVLPQVLINAIVQEVTRQNSNNQRHQYNLNNNQRGSRPNGNQHQWGRSNYKYNNNNSNKDWTHLPKLTPAERQYLIDNGGCFSAAN
ncbi:hypothetical protein KVV02_006987 [Mortierella alpina]|uniref:Uncharacterized protein n=1 Tax=Mortierella alpina TaxID=64518 RepID=A0A9P8CU25_MORAP|nr:hypothetical protein KVV02_006987 [Mortierella alpina]